MRLGRRLGRLGRASSRSVNRVVPHFPGLRERSW